ncbi:MAG: metal ABC transporter permease [Gemmatimonadota bacterium]|nr:MAG: metal ABC transporter permease [Gemmatimonadota bacterium]
MELMMPALVASLILMGLHAYLGIHIIARGVIFVDLALAQVAALGWAAAGLGLGHQLGAMLGIPESGANYLVGLGTALVAAALFSLSRMEQTRVPQEAIIGIVYVVASAGTILLASQAPRGSEHVEHLLTGGLLWVTWPEIWRMATVYAVLGIVHWLLRKRFLVISLRPHEAKSRGWSVRWWDFLFYAIFGVVVTISVAIAGVLVVFSFLVIPAVIAFLFTSMTARLMVIAWASGTAATVLGLYISYVSDLPTGPVVVCAFALALILAFALRRVLGRPLGRDRHPGETWEQVVPAEPPPGGSA